MQVPKGATVNLSIKEDGTISLDVTAAIQTRPDAIALAVALRRMGRSLPDTQPKGSRLKAISSRRKQRTSRKASASDAAATEATAN
jgi:hypothetical protein